MNTLSPPNGVTARAVWGGRPRERGKPGEKILITIEVKIDDVAIYDRGLSPLEVSDHFRLSGLIGNQ